MDTKVIGVEAEAESAKRARRADAERNHERLLQAARALVAQHGSEVALEEVAREAGVGVGTLYRHFPTRQALLEAIFLDDANELTALAENLAADGKPYQALVTWLRMQMAFGARGRSLGAAVLNAKHTEGTEIYNSCVRMRAAGEVLLLRAQEAGEVRPDVLMTDLLKMIHGIVVINEQSTDDPGRVDRMFDLVMGGLRSGAGAS